jgi:hypothetical protein
MKNANLAFLLSILLIVLSVTLYTIIYFSKKSTELLDIKGDIGLTKLVGAKVDKVDKGDKGDKGDIGLTGLAGAKGDKGDIGLTGDKGDIGLTGDKGDIGLTGDKGAKGDIGLTGLAGAKGDIGLTGLTGAKGDIGLTGLTGAKGDIGLTGLTGLTGAKGDIGLTGLTGAKGDKGDKGDIGVPLITDMSSTANSLYLYLYNTTSKDIINKSTKSLDGTPVRCNSGAIKKFQLVLDPNDKYHYEYTCNHNSKYNTTKVEKSTNFNDAGDNGNIAYLDRHSIDCGDKNALSEFKFVQNTDPNNLNQFKYSYVCNQNSVGSSCRTISTSPQIEGDGNNLSNLSKTDITCNDDEVLNKFAYKRDINSKYRYDYVCCK